MVDEKQIKKWVADGTINQAQAKKMLADSNQQKNLEKSNRFIQVIATIGAVLIFVGVAWLVARNWHQIASPLKVLILVSATVAGFAFGIMARLKNHEGVGRALITLGALLYILSLFLISQTYHLATDLQHYAWILFFAWSIIMLTAYLLDSKENLVVAMLTFFPWVIIQYISSIVRASMNSEGGPIFGFVLIFLGSGALLFGLSVLHSSIKHEYAKIYRYWTVLYFLIIFYILSFQIFLPMVSEYSFESGAFSAFLVIFIILCFFGFLVSSLFAVSRSAVSIKEISFFIGIVLVLFLLILVTKSGAGNMGYCSEKYCQDLQTESLCNAPPGNLLCEWEESRCITLNCYYYKSEVDCNAAPSELLCEWKNNTRNRPSTCQRTVAMDRPERVCQNYNNQKDNCLDQAPCKWRGSFGFSRLSQGLPTTLWFLWIVNNFVFIGFMILMLWYGQRTGSTEIVNLAILFFILEIITRYIGFWMNFRGYVAFSVLAILGGLILIAGAWYIPKWRRKMLDVTKQGR